LRGLVLPCRQTEAGTVRIEFGACMLQMKPDAPLDPARIEAEIPCAATVDGRIALRIETGAAVHRIAVDVAAADVQPVPHDRKRGGNTSRAVVRISRSQIVPVEGIPRAGSQSERLHTEPARLRDSLE